MPPALLDFDLHISADADGYRVRLLNSPRGSLPAQPFILPFSQTDVATFAQQLLYGPNRQSAFFQGMVKIFGGQLYNALFGGEIGVSLGRCLDEARAQGVPLRLKLRLHEAPELSALPWEFLYHASRDNFLVLDVDTPLVHSLELADAVEPIAVVPPLSILAVFSTPAEGGPALDVEAEWHLLCTSLADLIEQRRVVVERLTAPTLPALQRTLSRQPFHILHFVGHGLFDEEAGGVLLFEDERGEVALVEAERLGRLLATAHSLRLAVLNACEGARTALNDPFAGVAQTLLRQGIPAVIAMQFPFSDKASLTFSQEFYSCLADGHTLDRAVNSARVAIYTRHGGSEWATPRLFMHAADGVLWRMPTDTAQKLDQASADAARTGAGLSALANLMQKPVVRDAVVAFQTDLEAASQQIDLLSALKEMHDHLHNVEFQCYRVIEQEIARFPADAISVENLLDNELTLQDLADKVQQTAARALFAQEISAWIGDLTEARRLLRAALQAQDPQSLRGCVRLLRRILTKEPSRINERLNRTAGSLRLGPIKTALAAVAEQLAAVKASVDPDALRQLGEGIKALGRLAQTLAVAVRDHSRWQNLDVELRRVDAVLVHDLDELIFTWPDVRRMAQELHRDSADGWAETLRREEGLLEDAIQSGNLAMVRRTFFRFRRQAGIRFYQVDAELKNICGEVARIAVPLDSILRLLG